MQTVKVRLRKPGRVLSFLNPDIPLQRDEPCVVRSDRGLEFGTCVLPPEPCPPELEQRIKMNVIRKLNYHDEGTYRQILAEEKKAMDLCGQKMRDRKLPMRLVDVEYSMDKRKVVFYFTAEDRVDFRELVRDLAHDLKTRIELRHIQVRDAAKMIGGIGTCGRELCCTTWLQDFMPISMKMAKRQNLSLNPTKISGQCGRLMCCISYENEMYVTEKKVRGAAPAELTEEIEVPVKPVDTGVSTQDLFRLKLEADAATARAREKDQRPDDAPAKAPITTTAIADEPDTGDEEFDEAEGEETAATPDRGPAQQGAAPNANREGQRRPRRRRRGRRNRPGGGQGGGQQGGGQPAS
ncbi:MAG: stage 0 sporulation family protein [Candidatus Hydrogenedentes bacterium]|nr:stage 0 sporulation family protein [Candidatus Hydrogenedentota bacterium]